MISSHEALLLSNTLSNSNLFVDPWLQFLCVLCKKGTLFSNACWYFGVAPKIGVHNIRAVYFWCMTPCQLWNIKLQKNWQHLRARKKSSYLEQSAITALSYFTIHDVVCFHPKRRPLCMWYFNCVQWISRSASTHYWGYICVTFFSFFRAIQLLHAL